MDFLYWLTIKLSYTTWVLLLCMSDWWNSSGFIFRHTNACQIECAKFHRTSSRPNDPSALLCVCLSSEVIRVFRNTLDWHDFDKNTYFTHSLKERDQLIQCYVTWCYFLIKKREKYWLLGAHAQVLGIENLIYCLPLRAHPSQVNLDLCFCEIIFYTLTLFSLESMECALIAILSCGV